MTRPVMLADGGEITVVRRAANFVYGSWRVTVPDGAEQVVTSEDRTDGYLYHPVGAPSGRFDLAFVRQDATITLHEVTEQGVTSGDSDVELQMEAGQLRSEGRALIDRNISTAGLGRLRPGVDFVVGDVWPVKIWGRVVELVIAGFDWVVEDSGRVGVSVRAGGQLISDPELLRFLNSDALMQLDAEARRAAAEEKRLAEQAATDRAQTSQIKATQTSLSLQQGQLATTQLTQRDMLNALGYAIYASRNIARQLGRLWDGEISQADARSLMRTYENSAASAIATWEQLQGGN